MAKENYNNKTKKYYTPALNDVICEELVEISKRRKKNKQDTLNLDKEQNRLNKLSIKNLKSDKKNIASKNSSNKIHFPDIKTGLLGLSFSGGGIRSATFNLGILQELAKKGILKFVDYLSTVSGGGYIGSCLSSLLMNKNAGVKWDNNFPFYFNRNEKSEEREEVMHLRRYSNYLLPDSVYGKDLFNLISSYITGFILTNIVTVAFIIIIAFFINFMSKITSVIHKLPFYFFVSAFGFLLLSIILRFIASVKFKEPPLEKRLNIEKFIGMLITIAVISSIIGGLILFTTYIPQLNKMILNWSLHSISITSILGLLTGIKKNKGNITKMIFSISLILLLPLLIAELLYLFAITSMFKINIKILNFPPIPILLLIAFGLLILSCFIKTNRISVHSFYRDKLSKAYILKRNENNSLVSNDRCKLNQLHENVNGPYHIINATINIPTTENTYFRGRKSDLFIFSKLYCGSSATGYRKTYKYYRKKLTLTTAMAISGAALSPEMGMFTNPVLSFFLTLFNIRLNRWLPNPKSNILKEFIFLQPYYFIKELFCRGNEKDWHISVSDGGHFENSGLYSLIQRRCRYIIVSDAGEDAKHIIKDLAITIRRIRIDMGVDLIIDFTGIRPDENTGYTPLHHAVGKIIYPESNENEPAYIVYIKTILTGNESEDILSYKRQNSTFPDQTTLDQFFDEAQFESYRKLGNITGKAIFKFDDNKKNPLYSLKKNYTDKDLLDYFNNLYIDYKNECEKIKKNK